MDSESACQFGDMWPHLRQCALSTWGYGIRSSQPTLALPVVIIIAESTVQASIA